MSSQPNSNAFFSAPDAYDDFMGRYSRQLAKQFVKTVPLKRGDEVLDLGCGPGALTTELVAIVGATNVSVVDPSPPFLEACVARHHGVTGKVGRAEELPFDQGAFDAVLSQLVIHFVEDMEKAGQEIMRVTRPGGYVAMCTWIVREMELFAYLDQAAQASQVAANTVTRVQSFEEDGSLAAYMESIGLTDVEETTFTVSADYRDFDDLWRTYTAGVGPLGPWLLQQSDEVKASIRAKIFDMLDQPTAEITVTGTSRSASGRAPD